MNITKERVESILKTLPIGYYLGRNIKVEVSETENTSYIILSTESITIAMKNLTTAFKKLKPTDKELEQTIRAILYHELSHAMLTPKHLTMNDIMNIFEDERIETILKYRYIGVNFKKNLFNIVDITTLDKTNPIHLFFRVVRFRTGPKEFVDRVNEIIQKYRDLHSQSSVTFSYERDVLNLYNNIQAYIKELREAEERKLEQQLEQEKEETPSEKEQTMEETEQETETEDTEENIEEDTENAETETEDTEEGTPDWLDELLKQLEVDSVDEYDEDIQSAIRAIDNALTDEVANEFVKELTPIVTQASSSQKASGSAIPAYSGVFDPRSVANNDYRYFAQKNRTGHLKQLSKVQLNLFIDISGSFRGNENIVNSFLKSLMALEKSVPDFRFDVVTIAEGEKLLNRSERFIKCTGGNALTDNIFDIAKGLHKSEATVHNVVMFDGDAFSHDVGYEIRRRSKPEHLKVFNTNNTYIVSDKENYYNLQKYAPLAKTTITNNYAETFKEQIISILKNIFR